ncbi:hypothetical protein V1504DRAFT_471638 [Lipomyces starkeyi]
MSLVYGEPDPQSATAMRASQSVAPIATPASEISQQSNREPARNATRAKKGHGRRTAIPVVREISSARGSTSISDSSAKHGKRLKLDSSFSVPNHLERERGTYDDGNSEGAIQDTIVLYGDHQVSPPSGRPWAVTVPQTRKRRAIELACAVHEDIVPQTIRQIYNRPDKDK